MIFLTSFMKTIISTDKAPKAVGPYSQAVQAGHLLFCSGQIPIDPVTNELISGGVEKQTQRVMENLQEVLEAAGSSLEQVLKATIYVTDMNTYSLVNEVYGSFFDKEKAPARECVEVSRLPKDVLVEVSVIAVVE